jgi:hypothetical protein
VLKARKKPVEIDYMPWDGTVESAAKVVEWINKSGSDRPARHATDANLIFISTLEGVMEASPGDLIIRGVQGEHYPCKPDIFAETYEQVAS